MEIRPYSRSRAFTLIELLVVISIIIVLMGLLFPAFRGVQDQAKRTQAKNDLTQIVTAVNAFYTEYGKYPITTAGDAILPGDEPQENLMDALRGLNTTMNPRSIVFFSPPDVKDPGNPRSGIAANHRLYDPWGKEYVVAIDGDYDNSIAASKHSYPDLPNAVRSGVISWSYGKDGAQGTKGLNANFKGSDDVISWQ